MSGQFTEQITEQNEWLSIPKNPSRQMRLLALEFGGKPTGYYAPFPRLCDSQVLGIMERLWPMEVHQR